MMNIKPYSYTRADVTLSSGDELNVTLPCGRRLFISDYGTRTSINIFDEDTQITDSLWVMSDAVDYTKSSAG